jgi:hypothetical protein
MVMASLIKRLHRKNASGDYDVVYLETSADCVKLTDGSTTLTSKLSSIDAQNTWYGTCDTAEAEVEKIATVSSDFKLVEGAKVAIKFTYRQNATSPTLNVNGTGAYAICRYSTTAVAKLMWYANMVVEMIFDGTNWKTIGMPLSSTSYYGVTKLTNSCTSTSTSTAATANSVALGVAAAEAYADGLVASRPQVTVTTDSTAPTDQSDGDLWFEPLS